MLAISSADAITITILCTQQLDAEWPLQTQTQQTKRATLQQVAISLMHLICVSPEVPTLRTLCCLLCCLFVCCLHCFGLFTLCCLLRLLLCFVCLLALCCLLCFACLRCLLAVKIPLFYFPRKIVLTSTAQLAIAYHDSEPKHAQRKQIVISDAVASLRSRLESGTLCDLPGSRLDDPSTTPYLWRQIEAWPGSASVVLPFRICALPRSL